MCVWLCTESLAMRRRKLMLRSNVRFGINQRTCVGLYYYRAVPLKAVDIRVPTVTNKTCMCKCKHAKTQCKILNVLFNNDYRAGTGKVQHYLFNSCTKCIKTCRQYCYKNIKTFKIPETYFYIGFFISSSQHSGIYLF